MPLTPPAVNQATFLGRIHRMLDEQSEPVLKYQKRVLTALIPGTSDGTRLAVTPCTKAAAASRVPGTENCVSVPDYGADGLNVDRPLKDC